VAAAAAAASASSTASRLRVMAAVESRSMNDIVVAAVQGYLRNFRLEPDMLEMETVFRDRGAGETVSKEV